MNALVCFEVAARHLNFTEAGKELHVSRVAISRQIRSLEDYLGFPLFIRGPRSLTLTPKGEELAATASECFDRLKSATKSLTLKQYETGASLAATIGIATYWLMPRISKFHSERHHMEARLTLVENFNELPSEPFDIFICYGDHKFPQTDQRLISPHIMHPICSQEFMTQNGPFETPEDILNAPLLNFERPMDNRMNWKHWAASQNIEPENITYRASYSSYVNYVQAMVDGHGVGLGGVPVLSSFLDRGILVPLLPERSLELEGYYICWPREKKLSYDAKEFLEWLLDELDSMTSNPIAAI